MSQFVFQDMVNKLGIADQFLIDSRATSTEEIGNPPHRGTIRKMREEGIPVLPHRATQITWSDYHEFDYIITNSREATEKYNAYTRKSSPVSSNPEK